MSAQRRVMLYLAASLLGEGIALFGVVDRVLELLEFRTFSDSVVKLTYRSTTRASP